MKVRSYILFVALICLPPTVSGQEQGTPQGASAGVSQGASLVAASSMDSQGIRKYLLGPGDTLDIRIFGQSDLNWTGEVEADGTITSLPFIEKPILAKCRTDKEVQREIIAAYSKFLRSPQISVRVTGRNSRSPATVFGAVAAPTRVQMLRPVRLNEMLTLSGGLTERANGDIQILHTEQVMCPEPGEIVEPLETPEGLAPNTRRVYKWVDLLSGKSEGNPLIRPGDVVTVMESKPVYITGAVASPQPVLLRDGYTLTRVLAMVGGVTAGAKSSDVRIYRNKEGSPEEVIRVDLGAVKKKKSNDVVLLAYDIIEIPKASEWSASVLLKGLAKTVLGGVMGAPAQAIQYRVIY